MALSSCETEYVVLTLTTSQGICLIYFLKQLIGAEFKPVKIYVHNIFAIELVKNPAFHNQSKHVKIQYPDSASEEQRKDILKKSFGKAKFSEFHDLAGICNVGHQLQA